MEVRPNPTVDNASIPQLHHRHATAASPKQAANSPIPVNTSESILFFLKFQFVSRENSKKKERKKFPVYTSSISQRSILIFLKFLFVSQENNKKKERKKFPVNTSSISQRSILFFLKFLFVYRENNKKRERKKFFLWVTDFFIYLLFTLQNIVILLI